MKLTDATEQMTELEKKYFELVWLARQSSDYPLHAAYYRIEKEHAKDVAELSGEHADWEHGFNSGCLAAFRLALSLLSDDPDERAFAIDEFPFLDT